MPKTAKTKGISKKRVSTMPVTKGLDAFMSQGKLGTVESTRKKKNPYRAVSADGKNIAFGATKEEAVNNLFIGVTNREK